MSAYRSCPGCGFPELEAFFESRRVPVDVGVQWESREAARDCPRGDIRLAFCRRCGLVANTSFDPGLLSSDGSYENPLDCSPTFQAYARALAQRLIEDCGIRDKTVVEIGCGSGAFLRLLCTLGNNRGVGFDPGANDGQNNGNGKDEGLTIIADKYSPTYEGYHGNLLCCRHLLDHIGTPREFLLGLREIISASDDAVAYFEVPDCQSIFLEPYPWLIIYEHCLYFTQASLPHLFTECGYAVQRVGTGYGDTFAFVEARLAGQQQEGRNAEPPDLSGLHSAIETFPARHALVLEGWQHRLHELVDNGSRVVLWGAGARSVGFTGAVGAADQIPYVVDLNPRKWGHYLSGTGQEIVPPEFLREYSPSIIIIMNAIYWREIEGQVRSLGLAPEFLCL